MSDDHAHQGGNPNQAHHFDNMDQQIEAGKLGMWLFLATEVLLFAGLFCAYCVYRTTHPEVFEFASKYLDTTWGAINTLVLIASSWTMALAVRAAQTNQKQKCVALLAATLLGAAGFMGIKAIEYTHKFHEDLAWGLSFDPQNAQPRAVHWKADEAKLKAEAPVASPERTLGGGPVAYTPGSTSGEAALPPAGVPVPPSHVDPAAVASDAGPPVPTGYDPEKIRNVQVFFGIYFCMTGLHGLHVIIGALVIMWVMWRAWKGDFNSEYYLPVDLAGLYWHLVDLIWIFLFPLLYLIG